MSIWRKRKKLSQWELANLLSVDRSLVSDWETGKKLPPLETRERICELLDKKLEEIFPLNKGGV
jgi:DNA-binding XRE family transcriptional regulator